MGACGGRSPKSHVNLKNSQCPISLNPPCPMSPLRQSNIACWFCQMADGMFLMLFLMSLGYMLYVEEMPLSSCQI